MAEPLLQSIQVGLPQTFGNRDATDALDQPWTTGFYKRPVAGPVHIGMTNVAGDGQADLSVHGGIDKAVLAYSADHYAGWRDLLELSELGPGAFGENLTIAHLTEMDVCIGDRFQCGSALLEVTQPRQPCWKLARRWQLATLPKLVVQSGRSGWYLRVLREGDVAAGAAFALVQRRHPNWTIERANAIMYAKPADPDQRSELASLPELSESWRTQLSRA